MVCGCGTWLCRVISSLLEQLGTSLEFGGDAVRFGWEVPWLRTGSILWNLLYSLFRTDSGNALLDWLLLRAGAQPLSSVPAEFLTPSTMPGAESPISKYLVHDSGIDSQVTQSTAEGRTTGNLTLAALGAGDNVMRPWGHLIL